jgi:predicted PurR-regulated permease PerM
MNKAKLEVYFFGVIFLSVIAATVLVLMPYLRTIMLAAIVAVMVHPVYVFMRTRIVRRRAVAAGITLVVTLVAIIVPLFIVGSLLVSEGRNVSENLRSGEIASLGDLLAPLKSRIIAVVPEAANFDVDRLLGEAVSWITHKAGGIFANTAGALLGFFVGLIAFYYFLKDGDRFAKVLVSLSPLDDAYDYEILRRLKLAISSVITGTLLIAILQGLLVGIGFALFGISNPILWGTIAAFAAMVPGLGTAIVMAPAVIYLFYIGSTVASLGLMAWGIVIVGLIDNIIGPRLMGRGIAIHPLFILLAVLGGLSTMGASGFILGPILLSLLVALGHIYSLLLRKGSAAVHPNSPEILTHVDYADER